MSGKKWTPKERLLAARTPGGRYVAACNTIVSDCIPVENYVAMLDVVKEYGEYDSTGNLNRDPLQGLEEQPSRHAVS